MDSAGYQAECKADAMLQALLQHASSAPETKQPELLQKCLEAVLPVCNGQVSIALAKSSDIETALNEYTSPGDENHFYGPFMRATNIALACLGEIEVERMGAPVPAMDIICQHNDMPIHLHQTHQTAKSIRKPDLVILSLNSACTPFGKKKKGENKDTDKRNAHMDTNATAKPKNHPRKDVLACIEFKRKTSVVKKVQLPPPSSYKVENYVPTKPEYLPVDHLKPVCPAPDPSQTPEIQPTSDTALLSSGLTTAQPSQGGSSSKHEAAGTLKSAAKKSKMNPDDMSANPDVTVQTGLYAAQMFAASLAVNYLLDLIVVDNLMWIWYYDRQGTIQSSGINFIEDLPRFMVLLYALQRFKPEDRSRNKDFFPVQAERKQCHEFQTIDEELGEVDLLLHTGHDERVTHYGLQGRATDVIPVTSKALTKKYTNIQDGMATKISWGEANCTSEPKILYKVMEIARVYATVKDHVPELPWHHTFTNPTSAIREVLGGPDPTTGSRMLHIHIFRKLQPITKLQEKEFFDVCFQCILCHATLWKEGVYHRNVSPGNMMWYKIDGKLMGVLNDCHLSSLANDPGPRSNERTGTVPFIAFDLLTEEGQRGEVEHVYRHELESFVWCFTWVSMRCKDRVLPAEACFFDEWATLCTMTCGVKKRGHFKAPARSHTDPPLSPTLEELRVQMSNSINTATTALEKAVQNNFEPALMRQQRAIRQVQEEPDLDVHDIVTMIQAFQSDVRVADIYLHLEEDDLRKLYLARYLEKSRG